METSKREIYQEIVLSHFRSPARRGEIDARWTVYRQRNPLCGDIVELQMRHDRHEDALRLVHQAQGCAVSVASCSILCERLDGMPLARAIEETRGLLRAMEGATEAEALLSFRGIEARRTCALLAWRCAENALAGIMEST